MNNPKTRYSNIVQQELGSEVLIYDLIGNKAFCLNRTSALVYQLADGTKTVAEIGDLMSVRMKTKVPEDLVWFALNELGTNNLLENEAEVSNHFAGLSRREIVKRVGLASMVLLPVISSLVAPPASQAASGGFAPGSRTVGQTCTTSPECASGAPLCTPTNDQFSTKRCCVGGGLRSNSGDIVGGIAAPGGTCATVSCSSFGTDSCCSGSALLSSCTVFPGLALYGCTCT
jgi:hypothetical protein